MGLAQEEALCLEYGPDVAPKRPLNDHSAYRTKKYITASL